MQLLEVDKEKRHLVDFPLIFWVNLICLNRVGMVNVRININGVVSVCVARTVTPLKEDVSPAAVSLAAGSS